MAWLPPIVGTLSRLFRIGPASQISPQFRSLVTGEMEVRDSSNAAFNVLRVADAIGNNDAVTLQQLLHRVQATTGTTTTAAATFTFVFPTPYATAPVISCLCVGSGSTNTNNAELVSVSTTQCIVRSWRSQAVAILGGLPGVLTAGIVVHVIAVGT